MPHPSIFDPADTEKILSRIQSLSPESSAQWGKMNAAQMVRHCQVSLQMMTREITPKNVAFPLRIIARLIKKSALGDKPLGRNSPTIKEALILDTPDFATERDKLVSLVKQVAANGPAPLEGLYHSFFGKMTAAEWNTLQVKHLDHHLRQFGA